MGGEPLFQQRFPTKTELCPAKRDIKNRARSASKKKRAPAQVTEREAQVKKRAPAQVTKREAQVKKTRSAKRNIKKHQYQKNIQKSTSLFLKGVGVWGRGKLFFP
ncbi:MAG: hypothetical protein J6R00_11355 [Lentisphaeria bacterium]|nr:hypothetical protein [Lentisphaeria bacterium]